MASLEVGGEVVTKCSKCELELAHVIVTMKTSTTPGKIQCKTCDSVHTFKKSAAKKTRKRAKRKSAIESQSDEWNQLIKASSQEETTYSTKLSFQINDLINHPNFGKGVVKRLIDKSKVEVVFETDTKFLVHNR